MDNNSFTAALFSLFDRQRFEENDRLAALIRDTDRRCVGRTLSDDDLLFVSAAGEPELQRRPVPPEDNGL